MKKLSITELIAFRKKSDRAKKTFVENIKSNKILPPKEGGGDYWVSSISAICNSYREGDFNAAHEKIIEIQDKIKNTKFTITKNMYKKNVENLQNYKGLDIKKIRPPNLSFLKISTSDRILNMKGLEIVVKPSHIFTFGNKDEVKVGAIWFTAKKEGYTLEEVGMFCDMLYRFLKHNYSNKYQLSSKYCIAVDMVSGRIVDYSKITGKSISLVLSSTLDEFNKYM